MGYDFKQSIRNFLTSPRELENLYRQAIRAKEEKAFSEAIEALYKEMPDNLLIQSWHYRLSVETPSITSRAKTPWLWALLTGISLSLIFIWLSDFERYYVHEDMPWLTFIWAPLTALGVLAFLTLSGERRYSKLAIIIAGLVFIIFYIYFADELFNSIVFKKQYIILGAIHLILIAWAGVGFYVLSGQGDTESRFTYFIKSLEVGIMAGLFLVTLGIFLFITFTLFTTLGVNLSVFIMRRLFFAGAGFIPALAVASMYQPLLPMKEQIHRSDLNKLIALILRLFVLPVILVLLVYIVLIPFRFKEPFYNRQALIAYNVMLFAVIALLLGIVPRPGEKLSSKLMGWLRRGAILLTILAELISLYAISAIIFRTFLDGFTPNRISVIGWNLINIVLLGLLLYRQLKGGWENWAVESRKTFAQAVWPYLSWSFVLLLFLPWLL